MDDLDSLHQAVEGLGSVKSQAVVSYTLRFLSMSTVFLI